MTAADRDEAMRMLEHELVLLLRRFRRGIGARATALHPDLNPTAYALLLTLVDYGPTRAADLAEMFSIDKGAVSRLVRHLEDLGFVERTPDPNDGRAQVLAASAEAVRRLEEIKAQRLADIPLGRFGRPEEVAQAALFLASDMSSYLTGIVIEITGGRHI